jgi:hypothetical protein
VRTKKKRISRLEVDSQGLCDRLGYAETTIREYKLMITLKTILVVIGIFLLFVAGVWGYWGGGSYRWSALAQYKPRLVRFIPSGNCSVCQLIR